MTRPLTIGALSKRTGTKVPTIRYYESIGLLPAPPRTASNRRLYGPQAEQRLRFVRHARALGFEVGAIRELLALAAHPEQPCADVDAIANATLTEIDGKIAQLTALRDELRRMIEQCAHERIAECRVIEAIADHGQCLHEAH
jgi:DNA-binding transcriptional MerR regulator